LKPTCENKGDIKIMNLGLDLSFLIPIDFWDYMLYAVFFVLIATIPAILSLRYDNKRSVIQFLLSVFGPAGIIYSLFKAWFAVPSNVSLHYLVFTGFSIALAILAGINFWLKSRYSEGISSNECFVSLFGCAIFVIVAFISWLKAWFVIPSDGFMDYLRFACIWGILALICAGILPVLRFTHNNFKGDWLIFGGTGFFFLMEMIYSLLKTWGAMPNSVKLGIIATVAVIMILLTGGAADTGTSGYQSE